MHEMPIQATLWVYILVKDTQENIDNLKHFQECSNDEKKTAATGDNELSDANDACRK